MKYQVAIIGGGPAGYTAAEAAGKAGLSVAEKPTNARTCCSAPVPKPLSLPFPA